MYLRLKLTTLHPVSWASIVTVSCALVSFCKQAETLAVGTRLERGYIYNQNFGKEYGSHFEGLSGQAFGVLLL